MSRVSASRRRASACALVLASAACGHGTRAFDAPSTDDGGVISVGADATVPDAAVDDPGSLGDAGGARCENLECARPTCAAEASTTIRGIVRDPAGKRPIYNALVYVPNRAVEPFDNDAGVRCARCDAPASGSPIAQALTDADGAFVLSNAPAGPSIPVVVQVGRWRRQLVVPTVAPCTETVIADAEATRLPRTQSEGDLPRIAIATGQADPMECLLRKIGIDDTEITLSSGGGRVHVYKGAGGVDVAGAAAPNATDLWSDASTLGRYDLVLFPCEGATYLETKPPETQQALIEYTSNGGRAFLTHFGYAWLRGAPSPFSDIGTWRLDGAIADPTVASVDVSFAKGQALAKWLLGVGASSASGSLPLAGVRNDLAGTASSAQAWLTVPANASVQLMSFNTPVTKPAAAQCGRVVYSNFHVAESERTVHDVPSGCVPGAMTPQELALEFMLFDLSSCIQSEREPPHVPPT